MERCTQYFDCNFDQFIYLMFIKLSSLISHKKFFFRCAGYEGLLLICFPSCHVVQINIVVSVKTFLALIRRCVHVPAATCLLSSHYDLVNSSY